MKNIIKLFIPVLVCGIVMIASIVNTASATAVAYHPNLEVVQCDGCPEDLFGDRGAFKTITNTVLYIVGVLAVVMLIIGGIRYVVSGGDSKKVTDAKNTILYAIIGLIICFLAYAIVNFVIAALPSSTNPA